MKPGRFSERVQAAFISNAMSSRAHLLNKLIDPRRNLDAECGYPETRDLDKDQYRDLFDRDPIANRVVSVYPQETWRCPVSIRETEDQDKTTPFEMAWDQLQRAIIGDSWHQEEKGNIVWEALARADVMSGVGHFGLLLIGIDDGKELFDPVDGIDEKTGASKYAGQKKAEVTFVDDMGNEVTETEMLAREQAEGLEEESTGVEQPGAAKTAADGGPGVVGTAGDKPVPPGAKPPVPGTAPKPAPEDDEEDEDKKVFNAARRMFVGNAFPPPKKNPEDDDEEENTDDTKDVEGQDAAPVGDAEETPVQGDEPNTDPNTGLPNRTFDSSNEYDPKGNGVDDLYDTTDIAAQDSGPKKANLGDRKLLYLRVFDESLVQITRYETDKTSPRYGLPVEYNITMHDPRDNTQGGTGIDNGVVRVHWTRVVHIADNRTNSEWNGVPRMRPVINRILDLRKVYGGGCEGYWKTCAPIYSVETHPQLGGDVAIDQNDFKDQVENLENGLSRWLAIAGISLKSTAPSISDPTPHINSGIEAICIQIGVPKRIFMGSERGELSSSQDDSTWNDRLGHRQNTYVTPRVIVPFVDRLIAMGVLPVPTGYTVEWEALDSLSRKEKADAAVAETNAMSAYISGGVEGLMSPEDYLVRVMEYTPDEAMAIIEAAAEAEPLAPAAGQEMFDAQGNPIDPMTGQPTNPKGAFGEGGQTPLTAEDLGTDAEGRADKEAEMAKKGVVVAQPQVPPGIGGPPAPGQPPTGKKPPFPPKKKPPVANAEVIVLNDDKFNAIAIAFVPHGIDKNLVTRITDKTTGRVYAREGVVNA